MKNLTFKHLFGLLLLLAMPAFGQTILTNTTLASAATDSKVTVINLTSATGVNAPSSSDTTKATFLVVDREWMDVRAVNGTLISVVRGAASTRAASHASSAAVFVVPAFLGTLFSIPPNGSCTRSNELALPRINPSTGVFYDCLGGQWVTGDADQTTRLTNNLFRFPDPGATALTALETAGTAPSANTEQYCTEIDLPYSMLLTGMAVLNGTTVGTDKHLYILYDSSGNVLANTATAGTTTSGASTYQKINFVSKFYAVGPARYFGCTQTNGTTDTIRHAITAVNDNVLGGAVTTQVFGTVANVTLPTTFTTAKAPYLAVF
jgi:hypothetical protein